MTGHNLEVVTGPVDVLVDLDNPRTAAYVSSGPGCGCLPGEGVTAGCVHPDGCGYQ